MRITKGAVLAMFVGSVGFLVSWVLAEERKEQTNPSITEVEIKVAEARCELARQQLARFRSQRRAPFLMVVYEEAVKDFEGELADLKAGNKRDSFDRLLTEMKLLTRIAAQRVEKAEAANAKTPGIVEDWEVALLRAKHDILRLGAAHGELLQSAPRGNKIDWQLEQLRSVQLLLADQLFERGM